MPVNTAPRKKRNKHNWSINKLIQSAGGIVKTKHLSDVDRINISDLRRLFRELRLHLLREGLIGSPGDIELLITSAAKMYAFTVKGEHGGYAICISVGTLRAVWNTLLLTLCDNSTFPDYGGEKVTYKVKRRISRKLIFGPAVIPAEDSQQNIKDKKRLQQYQDITTSRKELCETMYNMMADYLLYHEAMHITRNHFNFIDICEKTTFINAADIFRQNNKLFQFFEVDADMVALNFVLPTHPETARFDRLEQDEKLDFVFFHMFNNIILHQLFDLEMMAEPVKEQWDYDHPPPMIRSILYDNLLYQFFIEKKLLPKKEVRDQQSKAWWEASRIAIKLGFPKGRWHGKGMKGVSFARIRRLITEFNQFQDVIGRALQSGSYEEFKEVVAHI